MPTFTDMVRQQVPLIPCGRVLTYSCAAALADSPEGVRAVGQAMGEPCELEGWHRVVKADGWITGAFESESRSAQYDLLLKDGVPFVKPYRVDLAHCLWEESGCVRRGCLLKAHG